MEAKERWKQWQWRSNLRAMQQRVKQRFRIASSRSAFLVRLQKHNGETSVATKPFNALLSNFLSKHLNFTTAVAPTSNASHTVYQHQCADSDYTPIFCESSPTVRFLQAVALPLIGNVCHAFMHGFNKMEIYGAEKLLDAVSHRPQGQPLITEHSIISRSQLAHRMIADEKVSNHVASMDDPLVLAAMLPPHVLFQANCLRWTLCATDRCFTSRATSAFFECVKVLPLARGAGVYQKGVDMAVERLKRGDWVHIFPEGSRSRDGGKTVQTAKRGIGRLVLDAGKVPLVIPFVHSGMQEVMPIGSKFPSIRKRVVVLVGDPIETEDLFLKFQEGSISKSVMHEAIAFRVGQYLKRLKEELDLLVLSNGDGFKSSSQAGCSEALRSDNNLKRWLDLERKLRNAESLSLRTFFALSDEAFRLDSVLLPTMNAGIFQESIITRLKRPLDSAAFVGFAAQGLMRYGLTGLGKARF